MNKITSPIIVLKENIDKNDYFHINKLKDICTENDKAYLKLEIDYKLSLKKRSSNNMRNINEFMFYDEDRLIGYIGICSFGGEELEVNGLVHPDYRRQGIFSRLFSLVRDEFYRRENSVMLLLSDNASASGIGFIKKICTDYSHSEYDMDLDMGVSHKPKGNMCFRPLAREDAEKISETDFTFFDESDFELCTDSFNTQGSYSRTFVAEIDGIIIGKVRTEMNDKAGGIYGLEVKPEYRGRGYGRELLIMAVNSLKENNPPRITLQVVTDNANALGLYKSCGFKENYIMDYYSLKK